MLRVYLLTFAKLQKIDIIQANEHEHTAAEEREHITAKKDANIMPLKKKCY